MTIILFLLLSFILWWSTNVIYSLFFSPLRKIPSPWIFQLFPGYFTWCRIRGASPFLVHHYHLKYGNSFRVGWRRVLFVNQEASQIIYGTHKCLKAPSYEGFSYFGETLFSTRDRHFHSRRKQLVAPAFTKGSIAAMEPAIHRVAIKPLLDRLRQSATTKGITVDLYRLFHYAAWDIIGELAFGKTFGMVTKGDDHPVVDWVAKANKFSMLGALFPAIKRVKFQAGENLKQFSDTLMKDYFTRQASSPSSEKKSSDTTDNIIGHFMKSGSQSLTKEEVFSEAVLMLFAGTDTVSNTLTWITYLLMTHPEVELKLRKELDRVIPDSDGIISFKQCETELPYLQAVIKESLRILPAAPGTPVRVVQEPGITINGYYLPPGTECAIPIYSLHRSPELWADPDKFHPDRWLDPNLPPITTLPYLPFLMGPRACIGKHLAWVELTTLIATLHHHLQFHLAQPPYLHMSASPILRPHPTTLNVTIKPRHRH